MARDSVIERRLSEVGYGRMIRALNEVHYSGETGFYGAAGLRPCEKQLFERYGRQGPILDVGCGAGRVTRAFAERGGRVVGVDINAAAIVAGRKATPDVEFVHASMTDLPLRTDSFEQVWCLRFSFNALPTMQERLDTLRELWRVCAPGGMVLIEAFNWYYRGRLGLVRAANLLDQLARTLRWHGECGSRSLPVPARDILYLANKTDGAAPGYAHLTTASELHQLANLCGLAAVATVTSEAALLSGAWTAVRPRHGGYSMWLALTKPARPS